MPITKNGSIKYEIPKKIKDQIDYRFLKKFMKELVIIDGIALSDFSDDSLAYEEGTGGWAEAFISACRKCEKDQLAIYYSTLPWYDSDMFDCRITEMLEKKGFIMKGSALEEAARQNGLSVKDVRLCDECWNIYEIKDMRAALIKENTKKDLGKITKELIKKVDEQDDDDIEFLCPACANKKLKTDIKIKPPLSIDINKSIKDILKIRKDRYFTCTSCKKIFLNKYREPKDLCTHCKNIKKRDKKGKKDYYTTQIELNKDYMDKLFPKKLEYKGFYTLREFSGPDGVWFGTVKKEEYDFNDLITFESDAKKDFEKEFHLAVDDYLEFKKEEKK